MLELIEEKSFYDKVKDKDEIVYISDDGLIETNLACTDKGNYKEENIYLINSSSIKDVENLSIKLFNADLAEKSYKKISVLDIQKVINESPILYSPEDIMNRLNERFGVNFSSEICKIFGNVKNDIELRIEHMPDDTLNVYFVYKDSEKELYFHEHETFVYVKFV